MPKPPFSVIWDRVVKHAGQAFHTRKGLPFPYDVNGNTVVPGRAKQNIPRSDFEKAYNVVPLEGPGEISREVRGSAYIWAILHDARIRQGQW